MNQYSANLFSETEKSKQLFNLDTHQIIFDRYHFAGELSDGMDVLEVGCGSGIGLEYLDKIATNLDAIEYSKENFSKLQVLEKGNARVRQGDAHKLPYDNHKFDLVIALAMIYYLSLTKFLEESSRVLKENGTIFFCTSNKDVPGFVPAPYTTKYYSIPELNLELSKAGYDVDFYGAFPANNQIILVRVFMAWVKFFFKALFGFTKKGKQIWEQARAKKAGKLFPLPMKLTSDNISCTERICLNPNKKNRDYRVIYVVAKKK